MTDVATALSDHPDSAEAGRDVGRQVMAALRDEWPDAIIVFASARHDYPVLLEAIDAACHPRVMVGCSSAGEFSSNGHGEGVVSAMALRSEDLRFAASLGRGLRSDRAAVARELVRGFKAADPDTHGFRYALVLTDALAGHADELVDQLTRVTGGMYRFFGGGAGDDARFSSTRVFRGTEAFPDAAVALEILSSKPLGIGVRHGWKPASRPLRATEAEGMRLMSLNATPALEVISEHADETGQAFDPVDPAPFFLQNVLGIQTDAGYQLRVPLAPAANGSIDFAADIPTGSIVHIMGATTGSAAAAATEATRDAVAQLGESRPRGALFFDCVATRLRTGTDFGRELDSVQDALGPGVAYAGCNTYGQIARAEGQFSGFHNCTAVVCVLPE